MKFDVGPGIVVWRERLSPREQAQLLAEVLTRVQKAPFFAPRMPKSGRPFSVRMTNFGELGWLSDEKGYRYEPVHPETRQNWPDIPPMLCALWAELIDKQTPPECCLVNYYGSGARMGLHRDTDEKSDMAVLSVSLGDGAEFRIGPSRRKDLSKVITLASGDVLIFGGPARMAFHGIDRVLTGSSTLIPCGGRINLTLRRVTPAHKKAPGHWDRAPIAPLRAGTGRG